MVLNFAEVIQLTEDYYAPGSLGSFNLQTAVTVVNNQAEQWAAGEWELILIPMNSGIFVNERGTSSVYTGLLTKQDALDASGEQEHYTHGTIKRMIGGRLPGQPQERHEVDPLEAPGGARGPGQRPPPVRQGRPRRPQDHGLRQVGWRPLGGGSKLENRLM